MNPNDKYWDEFYKSKDIPTNQSNFANFCLNFLNENTNNKQLKLLDMGCGNGRDSGYFHRNGINVTAIDPHSDLKDMPFEFHRKSFFDFDIAGYDAYYLRFVVHALTENELDQLIEKFKKNIGNAFIMIETRSSFGITNEPLSETRFKSPIGDVHFRMLYSLSYLKSKLSKYFIIKYASESQGVAVYKQEDPFCIRIVLKNV